MGDPAAQENRQVDTANLLRPRNTEEALSRVGQEYGDQKNSSRRTPQNLSKSNRVWWVATSLFVLMAVVFVLATVFESVSPVVPFIRAFAEAAMVGALADWFAVVALFRRPLGLPIPHTGIIPRNKSRIGASLGVFVQQNFLTKEVLEDEAVNISGAVGRFLQSEVNRARVLERVRLLVPRIAEILGDEDVKKFLSKEIEGAVSKSDAAILVAKVLRGLTRSQLHEAMLDEALVYMQSGFRSNQLWFRQQLREASPWFIPEFVDRKIYDAIVTKAEQTLSEALANKDHEFRQRLLESLFACIVRLETSEELQATVQQAKNALLNSEVFREYVGSLRDAMLKTLEVDVTSSDSVIIAAVQRVLEDLMKTLADSPQFQRKCNRVVRNVLSALVGNDSRVVADLISRTVDSWDVKTLSEKLEEQVGADLQFIRINGTLVGGIAGVALYAASRYLE